jgi:hypothetical protein
MTAKSEDVKILYHGTSSSVVEAILREGLIPQKSKGADSIPRRRSSVEIALGFLDGNAGGYVRMGAVRGLRKQWKTCDP